MEKATQSEKKVIKINYRKLYRNEKKKRENIIKDMEEKNIEIEELNKIIEEKNKIIEEKNKEIALLKKPKGYQCSVSGNNYEKKIHGVVKNCNINGKPFNTQKEEELAGSSSKNDIDSNFIVEKDIGIEAKKSKTPDWMQCTIKYNNETKKWEGKKRCKIPIKCRDMFNKLINNIKLFDGDIPPFMNKRITNKEWLKIKSETNQWKDHYIDIPSDTIKKLYSQKGCQYIQISDFGLYHLGEDICGFDVPLFNVEQQLRIRIKSHSTRKDGTRSLSVTAACQPKNIKKLIHSKYSLDDKDKLPPNLVYNSIQ